jgi:hypothetical protein
MISFVKRWGRMTENGGCLGGKILAGEGVRGVGGPLIVGSNIEI